MRLVQGFIVDRAISSPTPTPSKLRAGVGSVCSPHLQHLAQDLAHGMCSISNSLVNKQQMKRPVTSTKGGMISLFRDEEIEAKHSCAFCNHGIYGWYTSDLPFCIMTGQSWSPTSKNRRRVCLQVTSQTGNCLLEEE